MLVDKLLTLDEFMYDRCSFLGLNRIHEVEPGGGDIHLVCTVTFDFISSVKHL